MPTCRVATIGAHEGAWAFIGDCEAPKLNVNGLRDGETLRVKLSNLPHEDAVFSAFDVRENGLKDLMPAHYVKIDSVAASVNLLCKVLG